MKARRITLPESHLAVAFPACAYNPYSFRIVRAGWPFRLKREALHSPIEKRAVANPDAKAGV